MHKYCTIFCSFRLTNKLDRNLKKSKTVSKIFIHQFIKLPSGLCLGWCHFTVIIMCVYFLHQCFYVCSQPNGKLQGVALVLLAGLFVILFTKQFFEMLLIPVCLYVWVVWANKVRRSETLVLISYTRFNYSTGSNGFYLESWRAQWPVLLTGQRVGECVWFYKNGVSEAENCNWFQCIIKMYSGTWEWVLNDMMY